MTHIKITIDEVVEFDGSVTEWSRTPPSKFKDQIKPGANPAPHMKGILVAVGDAILNGKSASVKVNTFDDAWSMGVTYR